MKIFYCVYPDTLKTTAENTKITKILAIIWTSPLNHCVRRKKGERGKMEKIKHKMDFPFSQFPLSPALTQSCKP
jgi:hypothetical protein